MGARTARADDEAVDLNALLEKLLLQLLRASHITQATQCVGAAAGQDVALAASSRQFVGNALHRGGHIGAGGHHGDGLDAQQAEQKVVAVGTLGKTAGHALLDHKAAAQAFLDRSGHGDAAMVGLRRAAGDQGVGALRQRLGNQELQLARLVATRRQAEQVVTLDSDVRSTQRLREAGQKLERRRAGCVAAASKAR